MEELNEVDQTQRGFFAAEAMQGMLASFPEDYFAHKPAELAKQAVEYADALIAELARTAK